MRSKLLSLPAVATLLVVLLGACKKEPATNISTRMPSVESSSAQMLQTPQPVVNLGVAGNFVILSKSGITDVYKSTVTGDIGTSPITGAAVHVICTEVTGTIY